MKAGVSETVGKTIKAVVVASSDKNPKNQVFLVFDDGTYFEFWGPNFSCASDIRPGGVEKVINYVKNCGSEVDRLYPLSNV